MQKIGRNDPCPCGSGKKYKKCCEIQPKGKKFHAEIIGSSVQPQQAPEASKVSSLFFRKATISQQKSPQKESENSEN